MTIWPDRSGSMRYRPERIASAEVGCWAATTSLLDEVYELDLVIEKYAYALELIQPPSQGKIAIRFLQRRGGGASGRHPVFVQWYKTQKGNMHYHRYKPNEILRRVKTHPLFEPVAVDCRELIRAARPIMERRENLLSLIHGFQRGIAAQVVHASTSRIKLDAEIEHWLPLLLTKQKRLKDEWREWISEADKNLPDEAVADPKDQPAGGGAGRPYKHPTNPRTPHRER